MSNPIDIKTKKIISQPFTEMFQKSLVLDELEKDIINHWDNWGKFQQIWTNQAYNTFKDFDKYLVLIYLIRGYFQQLSNKFNYLSYEDFYEYDYIVLDKLNLIKISNDLNIPKETIRRKINELQKEKILRRERKNIILNKKFATFQKPESSLKALSSYLHKKSKFLERENWFGTKIEKDEIEIYIKKYFTILWLRFLDLQIPFLLRHRKNFNDLETWIVWGNIALHQQQTLSKIRNESIERTHVDFKNYYKKIISVKIKRGVNASSISDISGIPRATTIRKLRWLTKEKVINKNKNLEYVLKSGGKLNKRIEETFKNNQVYVAEFLTDFFDYYKNSNFKP